MLVILNNAKPWERYRVTGFFSLEDEAAGTGDRLFVTELVGGPDRKAVSQVEIPVFTMDKSKLVPETGPSNFEYEIEVLPQEN